MKKVLFITYFWPPSGKASLHWPLAMINHLQKNGWQPSVLTVKNESFTEPDESLLNEVDENLEVIKTKTFEPFNIYRKVIGKSKDEKLLASEAISLTNKKLSYRLSIWIRMNLFIPDARIGWSIYGTMKGKKYLRRKKIDAIISIGPPHTAHIIGSRLSRSFNIPHYPVFIDPWVDIIYYKNFKRTKLTLSIDNYLEKRVLRNCHQAIFVTRSMLENYINKYHFLSEKSNVLYWGYSEKYFANLAKNNPSEEEIIIHTGNIFDYQNPLNFWKMVKRKIEEGRKLRIVFVGTVGPKIIKTIEEFGLNNFTEYKGFLKYEQMLNELNKASYLLVCATEKRHVPGKLFEYLRIGKPIIAFGDDNVEVQRIIERVNAGKLFKYNESASEMLDVQKFSLQNKRQIEIYERENIAKKLSEILNN